MTLSLTIIHYNIQILITCHQKYLHNWLDYKRNTIALYITNSGITSLGHTIIDFDEEADSVLNLELGWNLLVKIVFELWTMLLF